MSQSEFSILADVYVIIKKTVGMIQLCEQDAHEIQPEQDVPNSLNPKSAPRWGTQ